MKRKEQRLPDEYYELRKFYAAQRTDEGRLRVLREMLKYIPPKDYRFNKVRSHTTHLMRTIRERMKKKEKRDAALKKARRFFKTDFFSIALLGDANSGKTRLLNELCGTSHPSTLAPYETKKPVISVFKHKEVTLRVVEVPSAVKPKYARILREADLIVVLPGSNERFLEFIDEFEVQTPVKVLKEFPKNKWTFLDLIVVKLNNEGLVLFRGAALSDLDLDQALVNGEEKDENYALKDGDVIESR
ncbi:hypothetical protein GF352_03160 [archaeon]|nr:hypothetical protein [archaeon]